MWKAVLWLPEQPGALTWALGEAPGGTPGDGKSWDVSQHLQAHCHL